MGEQLYTTDGTTAGTYEIKRINLTGDAFSNRAFDGPTFSPLGASRFVFFANDGAHGLEPWVSDGTAAGSGAATVIAGTGADIFGFVNGSAGGSITVLNFNAAIDQVDLQGYAAGARGRAAQVAVTAQGNTTMVLPDQSRITFVGVTNLTNLVPTG